MIDKSFVLFKINSSPSAFYNSLAYRDWFLADHT